MSVTNVVAKNETTTTAVSPASLEVMEQQAQQTYRPPGHAHATAMQVHPPHEVEWVRNTDGTPLIDHRGRPITVDRMLATKPLRGELSTRPGPGNRKLTYLSGEGVTRTLNDIFGFDGWNLDIKMTQREECVKDDKGRYHVAYTATVRLTHRKSGAYKEDCGAGDAIDRSLGTAVANALKASITDAMKRAARHFGDKLGNSLYQGTFSINSAPNTLKDALDQYDIQRAKTKFGFPKDRAAAAGSGAATEQSASTTNSIPASTVKSGVHATNTAPTIPKAPVPSFNNNTASTSTNLTATKTTASLIAQTPSVQSSCVSHQTLSVPSVDKPPLVSADRSLKVPGTPQVPPFASRERPQPPFAAREQPPPPTSTQGLQSSSLFKLSAFLSASSTAQSESNPAQDENLPPIDFDALDRERPSTSTGNKRLLEVSESQSSQARKAPNPYNRASL